jgi:hypothetical protein
MSKTSMLLGLSESLKILSVSDIHVIGKQLTVSTILWILLSIQEPFWDVVLSWLGEDVVDSSDFFLSHLSTSLITIDLCNVKGKDSKSSTDSLDHSETIRGLLFTVDVCVLHSKNMSEVFWIL